MAPFFVHREQHYRASLAAASPSLQFHSLTFRDETKSHIASLFTINCTSSRGHHPSTIPQFQNATCQRHETSSTSPTSFFYSTSRHSPRHAVLGRALRVESACLLVLPSRGDNRPLNATEARGQNAPSTRTRRADVRLQNLHPLARVEFPIQMVGQLPHQLCGSPHQLSGLPHQLL